MPSRHANWAISGLLTLINRLAALRTINFPSSFSFSRVYSLVLFLPHSKGGGFHFPRERDNVDAERASEIEGAAGRGREETGIGTENRKKGGNPAEVGRGTARVKQEEAEWKRQPTVIVKSNWNLLMKFMLVTIKLSGLLAY